MSLEVANTIRQQIGARALFMMGAKNLMGDDKSLSFKISGSAFASHIKVTLDFASDTYTLTFMKVRGLNVRTVEEVEEVYADMMNSIIEEKTGLALSL